MPTVLKECNNQYAYLPKHSTMNALVKNTHTWLRETDSQQPTMVCVLLADMSKAFDRVDHTRLFQHLTTLNLCPQLLAWLFSYTTGRRQRVVANGKSSEWKIVTSGVPQGGVVSPYLFLLHLSTREVIFDDTLDTVYADDIGISRAVQLKDIETDKKMEMEAHALETWAQNNNMLLNGNKSVEIRICFAKHSIQPPPLILGGQEVPVVLQSKYLGYHLDNQLNGNYHIDECVKKASQRLHFLTVFAKHGASADDLVSMYCSLIRPCLEYANVLLVGCTKKQAALLESIQKRAQRIIERFTNTSIHLPDLQGRREQATIKLIQEMAQNDHPLHELFLFFVINNFYFLFFSHTT